MQNIHVFGCLCLFELTYIKWTCSLYLKWHWPLSLAAHHLYGPTPCIGFMRAYYTETP